MSLSKGGTQIVRSVVRQVDLPIAVLSTFLCPRIFNLIPRTITYCQSRRHLRTTEASRANRDGDLLTSRPLASTLESKLTPRLPAQCPGCGALSQVVDKGDPGFYTLDRKSLKDYFQKSLGSKVDKERDIFERSMSTLGSSYGITEESTGVITELSSALAEASEPQIQSLAPPMCDRCHNLKHHQTGVSIQHPSMQSIQETIYESPYKYNHIYHIVDAADFPMSLVQGVHKLLHLTPQRSLNRRSQTGRFYHGRKTEVSFIITRSDLLGPTKEQVDKLMPYLRSVLRDALGRAALDSRLGNVRCVSAKRQWWTKELKEEIWQRGGGGWMVGKVNVGKSQLFHEVFPKGRMGDWGKHMTVGKAMALKSGSRSGNSNAQKIAEESQTVEIALPTAGKLTELSHSTPGNTQGSECGSLVENLSHSGQEVPNTYEDASILAGEESLGTGPSISASAQEFDISTRPLNTSSLLPLLPTETSYPAMPLVSTLAGTTASPIRVPFGNGKGELIDLPGLSRGDLEQHVQPKYRKSLVMTSRVEPEQHVLKPGQSLLIGGFIRLTPTTPDLHFLAYNFTRLTDHQTSTAKAIGVQTRTMATSAENISLPCTEAKIASAGKFYLKYDITKARTGPVTRNDAAGIKVEQLPFRVLGLDILIEGVGWVELAAQVRKARGYLEAGKLDPKTLHKQVLIDSEWPEVEIFTPEGKFVGQRRPMNAWVMNGNNPAKGDVKARPRKAMKGVKKVDKMKAREITSSYAV